jgi:hypothetical protein
MGFDSGLKGLRYRSSTAFTKIVLRIPSTVLICVSLRFAWLGLAVAFWTDLRSVQIAHHFEEYSTWNPTMAMNQEKT